MVLAEKDLRDAFERCLSDMRCEESDIEHVENTTREYGAISSVTITIGPATSPLGRIVNKFMDRWEQKRV